MPESFVQYIKAVLQKWWWLVVGVIGGALGVAPLLGANLAVPSAVGFAVMFVGLSIAQFLAYHDLRTKQAKKEWEYVREKNIALITPAMDDIIPTLDKMRQILKQLTLEISTMPVDKETLDKVVTYMYQEYGIKDLGEEQLKYFLELASVMDTLGVGLEKVKGRVQWIEVENRLESLPKPDTHLEENIKEFVIILNGAYSYLLGNLYQLSANKGKEAQLSSDEIKYFTKNRNASKSMEIVIDRARTKVERRIFQLKRGDELK